MIKSHGGSRWLAPRSICWLRAAGEPADEAGEDQLIEFAANYGQSLDWIALISIRPSAGWYAIGHDDRDPAVRPA